MKLSTVHRAAASRHGSPAGCEPHLNHAFRKPPQITKGPLIPTAITTSVKLPYANWSTMELGKEIQ